MKKILSMILTAIMLFCLAACGGSRENTATVNHIKFTLPEGYTLSQGNEIENFAENEYDIYDENGNLVCAVGYQEHDWKQYGFDQFEQYFESYCAGTAGERVDDATRKMVKFSASEQGLEGYDSVIVVFTNKNTTATVYGAVYNEKDVEIVNSFLNAVK